MAGRPSTPRSPKKAVRLAAPCTIGNEETVEHGHDAQGQDGSNQQAKCNRRCHAIEERAAEQEPLVPGGIGWV